MRPAPTCAVLFAVAVVTGCSDPAPPAPYVHEEGGIRVTVEHQPPRIEVVRVADGEVIFDGGVPSFRTASAEIETQVGSFKFDEDTTAPWTEITSFSPIAIDEDG